MRVTLTGASGFIGRRLMRRLASEGHSLHVLGRQRPSLDAVFAFSQWDAYSSAVPQAAIKNADAIIHLAGEPVAQRWNPEVKSRIQRSRSVGTRAVVEAIESVTDRPHTLISASAIGYYGDRGEEVLEETSPPGEGFLPEVCIEWEREAEEAREFGVRVVLLRTGIVLGKEGGALKQMLPPFRLGLGGPTASGNQWMSWIHADDLVSAILFALQKDRVVGPLNLTSPSPVRNARFAEALGQVLHRPAVIHTPLFALRLLLGEAADVVLASQRVPPVALTQAGFTWTYRDIQSALEAAV